MSTPIIISTLLLGDLGQAVQVYLLRKGVPHLEMLSENSLPQQRRDVMEDSAEEVLFIIAGLEETGQEKLEEVFGRGQRFQDTFTVVITVEKSENGTAPDIIKKQRDVWAAADAMIVLPATSPDQAAANPATLEAIYKVITHLTALALDSNKAEVSVDFEDVKTVLRGTGPSFVGIGKASGEKRAMEAANQVISYPFMLKDQLTNSSKVLLNIFSGSSTELEMEELTEITDLIQEVCGDDCEVIFGHGVVESLDEDIEVFLIATQ